MNTDTTPGVNGVGNIKLMSYNSHGMGPGRKEYIHELFQRCDFLLIQEHWMVTRKIPSIVDSIQDAMVHGVSGMPDNEPLIGRPYGGCAIVWRKDTPFTVTPIATDSRRCCAVTLSSGSTSLLLANVYMPCDTASNNEDYVSVLNTISAAACRSNVSHIIIGGDYNTSFIRLNSPQTENLLQFMRRESLMCPDESSITYTFESKSDGSRSTVDHFLITDNIGDCVIKYDVLHEGQNLSDHYPICLSLNIDIEDSSAYMSHADCDNKPTTSRLMWQKATESDIALYKDRLNSALAEIHIPVNAISCEDICCINHRTVIQEYFDNIISACVSAAEGTIPQSSQSSGRSAPLPGWNDIVKEKRDTAIFWHNIWKSCGSPREGTVANIRRTTRAQYHRAVRYIQRNAETIKANKMADALHEDRGRDFWKEVKKTLHSKSSAPTRVDSARGDAEICNLFATKAKELYNSVSYNEGNMHDIITSINNEISEKCCAGSCYHSHACTPSDIMDALSCIKKGKQGTDIASDYVMHHTDHLRVHLSFLFTAIIKHGVFPSAFQRSTIVHIPKNSRKSLNASDNYRGIALSSVIGKVFDHFLLNTNREVFKCSDLQYGFKSKHSTIQCTFVTDEVIKYYMNGGSNVHVMLLDASRAFDRVQYEKLFIVLRKKGLCALVARVLANMYLDQNIQVRWQACISDDISVSNGVKQGGCISPILFTNYIDELLIRLKQKGIGCYIGNLFCGAFGYADDIILLAPTRRSLRMLCEECIAFAEEYSLLFNATKCKYMVFGTSEDVKPFIFDGDCIYNVTKDVHLGSIFGMDINKDRISSAISDMYGRLNTIRTSFKYGDIPVMYTLFKTQCMSLYGAQLWDYSSSDCNRFYTAWRKSIRLLLGLPNTTHCQLLHHIVNDIPVECQVHRRFFKFVYTAVNSNNAYTRLCAKLALMGSNSAVSKSLTYLCSTYNIDKFRLASQHATMDSLLNHVMIEEDEDIKCTAGAICDFVKLRSCYSMRHHSSDIDCIVTYLCTS